MNLVISGFSRDEFKCYYFPATKRTSRVSTTSTLSNARAVWVPSNFQLDGVGLGEAAQVVLEQINGPSTAIGEIDLPIVVLENGGINSRAAERLAAWHGVDVRAFRFAWPADAARSNGCAQSVRITARQAIEAKAAENKRGQDFRDGVHFQSRNRSGANSCRLRRQVCHSWAVPGEM
jgi:hypothetical protein